MNKKFTKLMAALALLVFMAPSMVGWGQTRSTETFSYGDYKGQGTQSTGSEYTMVKTDVSITNTKFYGNTSYAHFYANGTTTITPKNGITITQIVLTASGTGYNGYQSSGSITASTGSVSGSANSTTVTWTGSASSYFTISNNKQIRWTSIEVTYTSGGSTDPICDVDPTEYDFGDVVVGNTVTQDFTVTTANLTGDLSVSLYMGEDAYSVTPTTIPQDATTTTVTVTFAPTAVGEVEELLVISGGGLSGAVDVSLSGTGVCAAPATALAYTSPVNLTLSGSSVGCTLNPTANTGNGGAITYAITQGDVNHGILVNNEFEADALGTWVVTATQALNGTACEGTFDITINVYGPEQTITFNAGTGTSTSSSMTAAQGSTIQLPTATPSAGCSQAGWTFVGWTDEAITETTTAPTILLAAGENYTVTTSETLYAVYMQGGSSTCSVTFSESGYANEQTITDAQIGDCSTATFAKGTSSNAPKYYTNGAAIRCYGGNTITITGEALTEIALTFGTGDGSNTITTDVGSYSNGTWTGSANSVTFTIGGATGNRRIAGISVTCGGATTYDSNPDCLEKVATPVITLAEGTYTEVKTTTITCATEGATIYYTTDGTDPTTSSIQYTIGTNITIGQSMTLKAIAVKENMENSNIASATYTINIQYTLTINNENGNIRDIHVFDNPQGAPILYIDEYSGEELTEASVDAGTAIYVSVGGVVDCRVFSALTVTCGGNAVTPSYDGDMYSFTLNGNTSIAVSANDAEEYTLTVAGLEHVSFDLLVGSESDLTSLNANHQATVCEDVLVEVIGLTVGNGFSLQSVTLAYGGETQTITPNEYGVYAFNMPSSNATLTFTTAPITAPYYALYSGALTEGDYLIVYGNKAMNNTVESNRLQYETVTVNGTSIMTDNADIIWHIAPSGDYWTIYNAAVNSYAAATGSRNQAQLLSEGTDDKALWTATGNTTYEFENKARAAATSYPGNKWLRNNGTNGFACYSDQTGGALSLYKKVTPQNYTTMEIQPNQWYFIASPTGTSPIDVNVLSDLYYYDEQDHHWRNQKVFANSEGFVNFDLGKGYLCANTGESAVTLTFTGVAITANSYSVDLEYHANTSEGVENTLAGWNLVGNPFTSEAYIVRDYYVIGNDATTGKSIIVASEGGAIAPYTGVMVQAEGEGESVTFTTNAPENPSNGNLQMTVAQQVVTRDGVSTGSTTIDNAIVSFNEGSRLGKFYFGENDANIYIPQNGKEYAIVSAEAQGEMPVNFRATKNGTYTLTINPEGVEMNYLHLIDNMTGADIDLLAATSTGSVATYTFNASTTDYSSRFRLVFAANNEDGASTGSTAFAFYSNGTWVINNIGEATLQVVDVNGRILSSETVNGSVSKAINAPAGVYMLRLINGNDVKTQKIVVR